MKNINSIDAFASKMSLSLVGCWMSFVRLLLCSLSFHFDFLCFLFILVKTAQIGLYTNALTFKSGTAYCVQRHKPSPTKGASLDWLERCTSQLTIKSSKHQGVSTQASLGNRSKSIGRQMLLLIRGLKPHIDLLQGPNMIFVVSEFMNSITCCLLSAPPYPQMTFVTPK